jgi:transposase
MGYYYRRSFLSEELNVSVTAAAISQMLRDIGKNRTPIVDYMQHLSGCTKTDMMLIDATSILSYSENLSRVKIGLSKQHTFEPLFSLLYFYSPQNFLPAYYRLFDGNIKDVTMVGTAIKESGYSDMILIADKGFYSESNLQLLEQEKIHYIIPLKRNSNLIDYKRYKSLTQAKAIFFSRDVLFTVTVIRWKTNARFIFL